MNSHCAARRIEAADNPTVESRAEPDHAFRGHCETIRMWRPLPFHWQHVPGADRAGRGIQPSDLAAVVERKPELAVLVELEMLWSGAVAVRRGERNRGEPLGRWIEAADIATVFLGEPDSAIRAERAHHKPIAATWRIPLSYFSGARIEARQLVRTHLT